MGSLPLAILMYLAFVYGTGSSLYYTIFYDVKTWSDAINSCRRRSGYLVQDPSTIQRHIRRNESVWIGQYASPWMWARRCYKYQIQNNDSKIKIADNSVSTCQRYCRTANVWLQGQYCICSIDSTIANLAEYKWCNETCPGDQGDVCGGAEAIMHYEIWRGYPTLPSESNGMNHCVSLIHRENENNWQLSHCFKSHTPLCKTNDENKYYVPVQRSVNYSENVKQCLDNMSMIADVSDDRKLSYVQKYLDSISNLPNRTLETWIGLKRKRMKVRSREKVESSPISSCYYVHRSNRDRRTVDVPLGSCQRKMRYVCEFETGTTRTYFTVPLLTSNSRTTAFDMMNQNMTSTSKTYYSTLGQTTTSSNLDNAPNIASIAFFSLSTLLVAIIIIGVAVTCIMKKRRKSRNKRSESLKPEEDLGMDSRNCYEELGTREQQYENNYQQLTTPAASSMTGTGNCYEELGTREQQDENNYQQLTTPAASSMTGTGNHYDEI